MSATRDMMRLGDFTADRRMIGLCGLAIFIGIIATWVAFALLRMIDLFTNVFYFQRLSFEPASPSGNSLGLLSVAVPVAGALIIGLIARFGSERIRGHGIPEAIESILINGSRVEPKLALLKPVSSAISIGSGGPFGSEGPIIMTGGAVGSLVAQLFTLTSAERKILLVAGAAAGMSATFAAPLAAILLAVELLLFEWKPRSFVPVALASATAAACRNYLLGSGPLFHLPPHPAFVGVEALSLCALVGLSAGCLSIVLTSAVYASEDLFKRLPIHWMWWPAIGGLCIGLGGLVCPQALGVGYSTIGAVLNEELAMRVVLVLVLVKGAIWALSLGSGTSGGVLAPLLMMGGALGGLEAHWLPAEGIGFWPLVSMAAILGGTMRSPLTGIVFAVELTHDLNMFLPLTVAVACAHALTVLLLRRSILTEKVARRGFHVSREYAVDVLELLFVSDVMNAHPRALPAATPVREVMALLDGRMDETGQRLYPVLDGEAMLVGAVTQTQLMEWAADPVKAGLPLGSLPLEKAMTVSADEPVRNAVQRMASSEVTRLLVVNPADARRLVGKVALHDVLKARAWHVEEEQRKERVLPWEYVLPSWLRPALGGANGK